MKYLVLLFLCSTASNFAMLLTSDQTKCSPMPDSILEQRKSDNLPEIKKALDILCKNAKDVLSNIKITGGAELQTPNMIAHLTNHISNLEKEISRKKQVLNTSNPVSCAFTLTSEALQELKMNKYSAMLALMVNDMPKTKQQE